MIFGDYAGLVHVLSSDGTPWNEDIFPYDTENQIWSSPASADIDNDGLMDFVIASKNKHLYGSTSAYGIGSHRHNAEIQQELSYIKKNIEFTFTPHILPMFRGILSTIYLNYKSKSNLNKIYNELRRYYMKDKFIKILKNKALSTNDVINTNNCQISVCKSKDKKKLIILSSIDNLIKGGAGQAVQNLNFIYNFKFNEGLK